MERERFRRTFSRLEASPQAKEALLHMIDENTNHTRRGMRRAARLAVLAAAAVCLLTATALAASGSLRAAVMHLLLPRYGQGELVEIGEGHRTGSFDRTDVLNTFLERFDREGLGDGITVRMADGFHKTLLEESEDAAAVSVETSDPALRLEVYLERVDYEDTTGLWQVTGYRIVEEGTE